MAQTALVAPALLSADFARLGEALGIIKSAGASMVHVDVMDGHFTPDLSVGQPVIASLRRATDLVLDVRLAIERPERFVAEFTKAGADRVAVHPESTTDLHRTLDLVRGQGSKAGVALNLGTPLSSVRDVLEEIDFLTILAAESGLRERPFVPRSVAKVRNAARMRDERRLEFAIQVEGGVGFDNLEELIRAGADILVAGSAIFHSDNPKTRLIEMIRLASEMRQTSRV
jgi:ribulose-phosphate 3-epimerase